MKIKSTGQLEFSDSWISAKKKLIMNSPINRLKFGLAVVLVATCSAFLTGCGAYIGGYGGGDYGGYGDYDDGGDMYLFGGDYGRGRDVQAYSHRGAESRGSAHLSGAHGGGGHGGGGHGGGGRR
jgi:hypothetical protein